MLPQKIFKIRYLRLAKIDFPSSKVEQMVMNFHRAFTSKNQEIIWKGIKFIK